MIEERNQRQRDLAQRSASRYSATTRTVIVDGHDWMRATRPERIAYCRSVGGNDAMFYYFALNAFYDADVPATLTNPAIQVVSMSRALSSPGR